MAHRLAWLYMCGEFPSHHIDHINHNRADNRFSNLRKVTREENQKNMKLRADNTSGVCDVSQRNGKWRAQVTHKRKRIHLGYFVDKFEAICAAKSAFSKYGYHENHGG